MQRDAKLRELLKEWRKMAAPGSYGIGADMDINVGRAAVMAAILAYKDCADKLEKVLNEQ